MTGSYYSITVVGTRRRLDLTLPTDVPVGELTAELLAMLDEQGALSTDQRERYRRLLVLVARHRPLLDELFQAEGLPSSAAAAAPPQ